MFSALDHAFLNNFSDRNYEVRPRQVIWVPDADGASIAIEYPAIDLGREEVQAMSSPRFIEPFCRSDNDFNRAGAEFDLDIVQDEIRSIPRSLDLLAWKGFDISFTIGWR